jgi:RNA polymerase sigma-70 factor (ECF subfamily)
MRSFQIADALLRRLFRRSGGDRWSVPLDHFAEALEASARKAFGNKLPGSHELERFLESLHLEDLALACACAAGQDVAWEHFVREHRPVLYRSADAIDLTGGARELADSLYADLYGIDNREGTRQSLFRYFHGRSSLATWLRAVLAQRHVDRVRAERRFEPLPEEDSVAAVVGSIEPADPDRRRLVTLLERALAQALVRIGARDRLRLGCYYAQDMTLAEIGRLLGEHEATVSRHLASTRRAMRAEMERYLRVEAGLGDGQIVECFESAMDDAGSMDLKVMFARNPQPDRSK